MRETRERLAEWRKPALVLFAPEDPILGNARSFFQSLISTAGDAPTIDDAGHFLPEEKGPLIARHILNVVARSA